MNSLAFALVIAALSASEVIGEAPNGTTPVPDGPCSIAEMEHLNIVLQAVTGGYPPECVALRGLAPENITNALCEDDGCKQWMNGTLLLRNCGNPALNSWQAIANKRLSECQILEPGPADVGSEEITAAPSGQANEIDNGNIAPNTTTSDVSPVPSATTGGANSTSALSGIVFLVALATFSMV